MRDPRDISAAREFGQAQKAPATPLYSTPPSVIKQVKTDRGAPATQASRTFLFQSFFDSALLERALLPQSQNSFFVDSTVESQQIPGFAIGLHPSSETPVAIEFTSGDQAGNSQVYTLVPGQIVRPVGKFEGRQFGGFRWGLPFGWLGGGMATIMILQSADADLFWTATHEIIFHRARHAILQPADLIIGSAAPLNWPLRFPWPNAFRGVTGVPQGGRPVIGIQNPTRVLLVLRGLTALAVPADFRILWQASDDASLDEFGAPIATPVIFVDQTWGTFASVGAGDLGAQNETLELTGQIARIAANDGGIVFVDRSGGSLDGAFIDVIRYGEL